MKVVRIALLCIVLFTLFVLSPLHIHVEPIQVASFLPENQVTKHPQQLVFSMLAAPQHIRSRTLPQLAGPLQCQHVFIFLEDTFTAQSFTQNLPAHSNRSDCLSNVEVVPLVRTTASRGDVRKRGAWKNFKVLDFLARRFSNSRTLRNMWFIIIDDDTVAFPAAWSRAIAHVPSLHIEVPLVVAFSMDSDSEREPVKENVQRKKSFMWNGGAGIALNSAAVRKYAHAVHKGASSNITEANGWCHPDSQQQNLLPPFGDVRIGACFTFGLNISATSFSPIEKNKERTKNFLLHPFRIESLLATGKGHGSTSLPLSTVVLSTHFVRTVSQFRWIEANLCRNTPWSLCTPTVAQVRDALFTATSSSLVPSCCGSTSDAFNQQHHCSPRSSFDDIASCFSSVYENSSNGFEVSISSAYRAVCVGFVQKKNIVTSFSRIAALKKRQSDFLETGHNLVNTKDPLVQRCLNRSVQEDAVLCQFLQDCFRRCLEHRTPDGTRPCLTVAVSFDGRDHDTVDTLHCKGFSLSPQFVQGAVPSVFPADQATFLYRSRNTVAPYVTYNSLPFEPLLHRAQHGTVHRVSEIDSRKHIEVCIVPGVDVLSPQPCEEGQEKQVAVLLMRSNVKEWLARSLFSDWYAVTMRCDENLLAQEKQVAESPKIEKFLTELAAQPFFNDRNEEPLCLLIAIRQEEEQRKSSKRSGRFFVDASPRILLCNYRALDIAAGSLEMDNVPLEVENIIALRRVA